MEDSKIFQRFDVDYGIYFTSEAGFLIFPYVKHEWKYEEQNHVSGVKKNNSLFNDKTIEFSVCYNFVGCEHVFFLYFNSVKITAYEDTICIPKKKHLT